MLLCVVSKTSKSGGCVCGCCQHPWINLQLACLLRLAVCPHGVVTHLDHVSVGIVSCQERQLRGLQIVSAMQGRHLSHQRLVIVAGLH